MVSYYQKNRHNPEFRKRIARLQRERHKEKMKDPEYRLKMREYYRYRYHNRIKTNPQQLTTTRARIARYARVRRLSQQEVRKQLQALIGASCIDCGITDYRLLDFDHIFPELKTMNVSQKLHLPFAELAEEVMSCQLRCPNCHRLKTIEQGGHDSRIREFRNPKKHSAF